MNKWEWDFLSSMIDVNAWNDEGIFAFYKTPRIPPGYATELN
jgi:hypothetical protein